MSNPSKRSYLETGVDYRPSDILCGLHLLHRHLWFSVWTWAWLVAFRNISRDRRRAHRISMGTRYRCRVRCRLAHSIFDASMNSFARCEAVQHPRCLLVGETWGSVCAHLGRLSGADKQGTR